MTDRQHLQAKTRQLQGRKVRQLRQQGLIPGNIFGKNIDSLAVEVDQRMFNKVYAETGETGLIDFVVDDQKPRPVLVSDIQYHPINGDILHIDFRQVNLKEKITTFVPLTFVGESAAVKEGAVLVHNVDELEIEALPTDIPEEITVDVSLLTEIGQTITAGSLSLGDKVTLVTEPDTIVASAQEVQEEVEEVVEQEQPKEAETTVQKSAEELAAESSETK